MNPLFVILSLIFYSFSANKPLPQKQSLLKASNTLAHKQVLASKDLAHKHLTYKQVLASSALAHKPLSKKRLMASRSVTKNQDLRASQETLTEDDLQETEDEDFTPSLSDTLNDSHKMKRQIKRQLAKEIDSNPNTKDVADRSPKNIKDVTHFGDMEISISERQKNEELVEVKKKSKKTPSR